jgi:hypothetical protein
VVCLNPIAGLVKDKIFIYMKLSSILTEDINNYNKFPLSALLKQAKNFKDFKEFSNFYSINIYHGYYWHWTNNPNFTISNIIGPKDASSMSTGNIINKGAIMLTSDMNYWDAFYNQHEKGKITRPFAVLFDASDIDPKYLKQISRGFGNEIYLYPGQAKQLKQIGVYKRDTAKAIERKIHNLIPHSEIELNKLWKYAHNEIKIGNSNLEASLAEDLEYEHVTDAAPEKNKYQIGMKLNEQISRIKTIIKEISEEIFRLDDEDDLTGLPPEDRVDKPFKIKSPLEKQFSKIMADKVSSNDEIEAYKWSTYQEIIIKLENLGEHKLVEEIYYWITDGKNPYNVFDDATQKTKQTPEIQRLRNVIKDFKDVESGHEPTIDDFLNPTNER